MIIAHCEDVRGLPPPAEAVLRAADRPGLVLLDSGLSGHPLNEWGLLAADPFLVLSARGRRVRVERAGRPARAFSGDPFLALERVLSRCRPDRAEGAGVLSGSAAGFLSYDLGRVTERIPRIARRDLPFPDLWLAFFDHGLAWDVRASRWRGFFLEGAPARPDARRRLAALVRSIERGEAPGGEPAPGRARASIPRAEYLRAVRRIRDYIAAGDVFQVNFAHRFEADAPGDPRRHWSRLRSFSPAPFGAYLRTQDGAVLSISPESFLRVRFDFVETRPIKGTRPRGAAPAADRALARRLEASPKDRAELRMIVDLERNDLGRVCRYGSVKVRTEGVLETHPTVFHRAAIVEGRLRPDASLADLLRATFPGGSVTGAPKIRAMEIIEELEPVRRSVYTGAIGAFSFCGDADLSVAIRTALWARGRAFYSAGGGIVADSDPEAEYQETLDKARAFIEAMGD